MKKIVTTMFVFCSLMVRAYTQENDTTRIFELDEIQVIAIRAENKTPVTHSTLMPNLESVQMPILKFRWK